ncbi:hypothetical protein SAY86_004873 [Trapa natans]|uniref:Uncharacterized protein n=1 Tax=Trapa natans TaxID=22666 RepID=A0AAN7N5N9_TRANT|nr:hypothetical protein SAY86_004873 [Trapa natans]
MSTCSPTFIPTTDSFVASRGNLFRYLTFLRTSAQPCFPLLEAISDLLNPLTLIHLVAYWSGLLFMDDGFEKIKLIPDYFSASRAEDSPLPSSSPSCSDPLPAVDSNFLRLRSRLWTRRKLQCASFIMSLFSLRGLHWSSNADGQEKIELPAAEVESLKAELADLEERNAHLKAQLEQADELLRSSFLSGYLYTRTRWTALPGEPPPIDDTDVNDWLPRFVVLHGSCLFFYLFCTDLSPLDSTLLSDITEVGSLPDFTLEDEETRYCFYILTRQGLRYECSSISKIQVATFSTRS